MTQDREELKRLAEAATKRFAGPHLKPDGYGLQIWADSQKGGDTRVLDVRGWGYLTGCGHGALGLSEADGIEAQRAVQAYAVAAWNAVPSLLSDLEAMQEAQETAMNLIAAIAASKVTEDNLHIWRWVSEVISRCKALSKEPEA